jgi:hypothetical protein
MNYHRWARLLKQQSSTTVHCLPINENKLPFSGSSNFPHLYLYISVSIYISIYLYIYICCRFKRKTEAQAIFLNPFIICSSYKQKFAVCPFVDEDTNGGYPSASELNGLAHLCDLPPANFVRYSLGINLRSWPHSLS